MRLKIVQVGDPVLRQAAREMTAKEIASREIQRLIADMRETMIPPWLSRFLPAAVGIDSPRP